ncbi:hypothetical protein [Variovorax sp. E3]|uniref:hypothetical protein n=1 Tax=Variovorax sp. E3 TaxID=1914993 RepID=UPI0018DD0FA4|nr:hypothetical protein [Variovorax sp. E3]
MDKRFEATDAVKGIDPDLVGGDGFSWQATLLAAMVGVGGQAYLDTLFSNATMWLMKAQGYSQKEIYAEIYGYALTPRFALILIIDFCVQMAAGRVAASFAPSKPYLHATVTGLLVTSFVVIMMFGQPQGSVPTWYAVMALCMPMVGGLLGALSWGSRGPLRFRP